HVQQGGGMSSGIQDSHNLGWKLAAVLNGGPSWLLDTYEQERIAEGHHMAEHQDASSQKKRLSTKTQAAASDDDLADVLAHIAQMDDEDDLRITSQLFVQYHDTPLSLDVGDT